MALGRAAHTDDDGSFIQYTYDHQANNQQNPANGQWSHGGHASLDNTDIRAVVVSLRIASLEMLPNVELLPHLKCSRPGWGRSDSDEAGEHGDAG